MADDREFTAFPPPAANIILNEMTARQVYTSLAFVAVALVVGLAAGAAGVPAPVVLVGGGLLAVAGVAAAALPVNGRTVDVWGPQWVRWVAAGGRGPHVSVAPDGGWTVDRTSVTVDKVHSVAPPLAAGLELLDVTVDGHSFGLVADRKAGDYTIVCSVTGARFALTDPSRRAGLLDGWTDLLNDLALEGKALRRGKWLSMSLPDDGDLLRAAVMEAPRADSAEGVNLSDLVDGAATVTVAHRTWLALTIDPDGIPSRRLQTQGTWDVRVAAYARDVLTRAHSSLSSSGLTLTDAVLDADDLALLVRGMFDPAARRRLNDWGRDGRGPAGDASTAWPHAVEEHRDWIRTDSGVHVTFHVERLDLRAQPADLMSALDLAVTWPHTLTVVWEPISPEESVASARRSATDVEASRETESKAGFRESAAARRQRRATEVREEHVAAGVPECWMSAYMTVTVPPDGDGGPELAFDARDETVRAGSRVGLLLRPMDLQQGAGLTAMLPCGRGVGRRR